MLAVAVRLRAELRRQWRGWLGSAVMLGLVAGVVFAAAAGARRTATAYPRYLEQAGASDVFLSPFDRLLRGSYEEIQRLPQVAAAGLVAIPTMARVDPSGVGDFLIFPMVSADGAYGWSINRPKILEGRRPRPDRADEVLVDPHTARRLQLSVGEPLVLRAFDEEPPDRSRIGPSDGTPMSFRIVGIGVYPDSVVPTQFFDELPKVFLTPAAHRRFAAAPDAIVFEAIHVRLEPGADVEAFRREVDRITAADQGAAGNDFSLEADRTAKVQRAIRPQATALVIFALLAAIAGLLIVGQSLARQIHLDAAEHPILRAIGMSRRQLVAMTVTRVLLIGAGGALGGAVLAASLSPFMPIGPARLAEPDPGVSIDAAVLGAGIPSVVVLLLLVSARAIMAATAIPLPPQARAGVTLKRRWSLAAALWRRGAPASVVTGVRLALEPGRGRSGVPVRTTIAGTVLALLAVAASITFGANLDELVSRPSRYGQTWDAAIEGGFTPLPTEAVVDRLRRDPDVESFSGGTAGEVSIAGTQIPAVGIDPLQGSVFPTMVGGRPPSGPDEIVLGTNVLRRIHRSVGDRIDVDVAGVPRTMRIVGRAVFPTLGLPGHSATGLGEGAFVAGDVLPPASDFQRSPEDIYTFVLVRFRPDRAEEGVRRLEADTRRRDGPFGPACQTNSNGACVLEIQRPGDIANYARVRSTPLTLAAVLLAVGAASLAHGLMSSVGRRRDLAILKALGFVRHQVSATVAWQATAVSVLAVVIGVPLGLAAGRWAWVVLAGGLGVDPAPVLPLTNLVVLSAGVVVAANMIGLLPARAARRMRPAEVLRAE